MRVLVTGGNGFIGRHLVAELKRRLWDVDVIDRHPGPDVTFAVDVADPIVASIIRHRDYDIVYHLAAYTNVRDSIQEPHYAAHDVVAATALFAELPARLVFTSSGAVYGNRKIGDPPIIRPLSPYAWSKAAVEELARVMHDIGQLRASIFRLGNVYGPGAHGLIYNALWAAQHDTALTVYGDGRQVRDYVHVRDVVNALLNQNYDTDTWAVRDVSVGDRRSVLDVISLVEKVTKKKLRIVHRPAINGEPLYSMLDTLYTPSITLRDGITEMWEQMQGGKQ
jgi:UDP-glucose 4-epimerase